MSDADVLVIGAGVAGLAAALAARDAGARVTVLDAHAGASVLAGGAWDVASAVGGSPEDVFRPARSLEQALIAKAREDVHHPYAKLGMDVVQAVREAHERVLPALAIYRPLDLRGTGVLVATDLGLPRRAATAQHAVLTLDAARGGAIAVAVLRGYRYTDAAFVAASLTEVADLADDDRRFGALELEFFRRQQDALLHPHEIAAIADTDDGRARLSQTLQRAIAGAKHDAVLLPPVLGLRNDEVASELRAAIGVAIGELVAPLAGPQGLRLGRRLDAALRESGCERRSAHVRAVVPRAEGTLVVLDDGEELRGKSIVLATGKHTSGGLVMRGGELRESLADLPIWVDGRLLALASSSGGRDSSVLFGDNPFVGGPASRAGVAFDERFRAMGRDGRARASDLLVCGALLAGYDPARDGTGLGCAATTGWLAGRHAAT
jgi:glycerol-3-phosphate dehydrogenase subunit B